MTVGTATLIGVGVVLLIIFVVVTVQHHRD